MLTSLGIWFTGRISNPSHFFTVNYFYGKENIEGFLCEILSIEIGIGTYYLCDSSMVNHDTKKKKREKK